MKSEPIINDQEMSDIQKQCWSYVTAWVKEDCEEEDRQFIEIIKTFFDSKKGD
jgi:uncharacterized membrane-anchored protein YjiN (DUF445 family)